MGAYEPSLTLEDGAAAPVQAGASTAQGSISFAMTKLCDINLAARQKLPPAAPDKSGIGVHYVDAFVAPMNTTLSDGTRVSCKRKGLRNHAARRRQRRATD